ncbi:MAG: hypothetical protein E7126_07955 [Rikenellaceae bacterium]|nr:hypothetical protein [Rikenellaceae bacterium]
MELRFNPTPDQTFELEGGAKYNFIRAKERIDELDRAGRYAEACEARYQGFQLLADALPEDEPMPLRWEHANSRAAIMILHGSAIDHFRIGDLEMAMAQLELLLDCDPEDHLEAINLLTLCYATVEEWELYDEVELDLTDKSAESVVARLWASWRRDGAVDNGALSLLRSKFKPYFAEFTAVEHPDDDAFRQDIMSERPSQGAQAREWWLLTEPLWAEFPEFIESLK